MKQDNEEKLIKDNEKEKSHLSKRQRCKNYLMIHYPFLVRLLFIQSLIYSVNAMKSLYLTPELIM